MKKVTQVRAMLVIAVLVASGFLFSSCMHFGMLGHGGENQATVESTLVKEVIAGEIKAVATFPPLERGKEVQFTLKLFHSRTLLPLSGAQVYGHLDYIHRPGSDRMDHMDMKHDQADSLQAHRPEDEHGISWHQELEESKEPGLYIFSQTPTRTGEYTVGFHITAIGDRVLDPDVLIEVKRNAAAPPQGHHGGGMMGIGEGPTYLLVGGAIMGVMMIWMLLARGGTF